MQYRPEIDGLRALSVLAVIFYHYGLLQLGEVPLIRSGYFGVDVFFVVSGFVISGVIVGDVTRGRFSFRTFYARRVRRLLPAAALVLGFCAVISHFMLYQDEASRLANDALYSLAFLQNINLARDSGYFGGSAEVYPLLHMWSLSVEEQFYIVFPLIIVMLLNWTRNVFCLCSLFLLTALSFAYALYAAHVAPVENFYFLQSRAFELLLGSLAFFVWKSDTLKISDDRVRKTLLVIALFVVIASLTLIDIGQNGPNLKYLPGLISVCVLLVYMEGADFVTRFFQLSPVRYIGIVSYEWYLWHYPPIAFLTLFYGLGAEIPVHVKIVTLLLTFVLAASTREFISAPLRFSKRKAVSTVAGVAGHVTVVAVFFCIIVYDGDVPGSFAARTHAINNQFEGALWSYATNDTCLDKYAIEEVESWAWFFCYQDEPGDPEVVLIGDSYANHWFPMVQKAEYFRGKTVLSFGTCIPFLKYTDTPIEGNNPCAGRRKDWQFRTIDTEILKKESVEFVILAVRGPWTNERKRRILEILEIEDYQLIVITPHAEPRSNEFSIKQCVGRPWFGITGDCLFQKEEMAEVLGEKELERFRRKVQAMSDRIKVFDPNGGYCSSESCDLMEGGLPVFRDKHEHMSFHGNMLVRPLFEVFLKKNYEEERERSNPSG